MRLVNVRRQVRGSMLSLLLVATMGAASSDPLLIEAVKGQDTAAARELIARNVDVNAPQADGATALHWAVHRDDLETAELLLEAGADVNATNDFGVMPLSLACTNRNAPMTETLLKAGADPNAALLTGETLLMTAAHAGDLDTVDALLNHGADVNAKEPVRHQTALMWALGEKHTQVARRLIEHGADIYTATTLGFTPLLFAARVGDLEATRMLLDADEAEKSSNAGAHGDSKTRRKTSPAFLAALTFFGGETYVNTTAKFMLSNTYLGGSGDVKKKSSKRVGLSALHVATLRGHGDVAALLLDHGADPNYDGPGYTPLHWAVTSWETELNGANGMRAPKNHEWHRMAGVKEGKLELVKALLDHGADPNARLDKNPSRYGFTVASTRPKGSTPYVLAAITGEADIMRLLVENGADPALIPSNGVPPLLWAAGINRHRAENIASEDDSLAAVMLTVELGADVNATDRAGNTAMHGASWIRSTKIVQFLADNGADVNALNKQGLSPLYIADHDGRFAGQDPKIDRLPVGDLLHELSVPDVITKSLEKWETIPRHVRDAIESLLQGELDKIDSAEAK